MLKKIEIYCKPFSNLNKDEVFIIDHDIVNDFIVKYEIEELFSHEKISFGIINKDNKQQLVIITSLLNTEKNKDSIKELHYALKDYGFKQNNFACLAFSTKNKTGWFTISEHANLTGYNPLIGANNEKYGTRFPDMSNPYTQNAKKYSLAGLEGNQKFDDKVKKFLLDNNFDFASNYLIYNVIIARHCNLKCQASVLVK